VVLSRTERALLLFLLVGIHPQGRAAGRWAVVMFFGLRNGQQANFIASKVYT